MNVHRVSKIQTLQDFGQVVVVWLLDCLVLCVRNPDKVRILDALTLTRSVRFWANKESDIQNSDESRFWTSYFQMSTVMGIKLVNTFCFSVYLVYVDH